MFQRGHRALYAAFDRFPSRKGAAIHIDRFARTLFDEFGGGCLYVLGGADLPAHQREGAIDIIRFSAEVPNFLERALSFGTRLSALIDELEPSLEICHFRDPWSGTAIALRPRHRYATVYEVNALPSIELPSLFPSVAPRTLEKIRRSELACCDAADLIVTPSQTTATCLASLGVEPGKVRVIPNGADIEAPLPRPAGAPETYLLYFGSPQRWQGIDTLLRAFARLADFESLRLVIIGSQESRSWKPYEKMAARLGIDSRIDWRFALDGATLSAWRQHAFVSVAPLADSPRNVVQGCAPLKIVESMASGVAVVASDVPPVREIIRDRENGWLVHPDRPAELARALRILLDHPELTASLGRKARQTIEKSFTWRQSTEALRNEYRALVEKGAAVR
ncbi:MAG TPA: glycosyltransferase [Thermoanaerobaculia bacterium]|nr:glycosyltransferase [Thermoanaerobaculia bacterium]